MNLAAVMEPSPHKETIARNSAPKILPPTSPTSSNSSNKHKRSHSKIQHPHPTVPFMLHGSSGNSSSFPLVCPPQQQLQLQQQQQLPYYFCYPHLTPHQQQQYHMSAFQAHQFAANNSKDQFNRKRQRKIAAAAAFAPDSIWNNNNNNNNQGNNMGRKSTAQPRPVLTVPPRGIGPIVDPNENDVLCGTYQSHVHDSMKLYLIHPYSHLFSAISFAPHLDRSWWTYQLAQWQCEIS
jgi:hypothetical protein